MTDDVTDFIEDPFPSSITLSSEMVQKRVVWDTAPCDIAEEVADYLGLHGASSDVEDMEHRESHFRLNAVAPIAPVLQILVENTAAAVRASMIISHGSELEDEPALATGALAAMLHAATVTVLAELIDIGAIALKTPVYTGTI